MFNENDSRWGRGCQKRGRGVENTTNTTMSNTTNNSKGVRGNK
jgi:hypothetical protein